MKISVNSVGDKLQISICGFVGSTFIIIGNAKFQLEVNEKKDITFHSFRFTYAFNFINRLSKHPTHVESWWRTHGSRSAFQTCIAPNCQMLSSPGCRWTKYGKTIFLTFFFVDRSLLAQACLYSRHDKWSTQINIINRGFLMAPCPTSCIQSLPQFKICYSQYPNLCTNFLSASLRAK